MKQILLISILIFSQSLYAEKKTHRPTVEKKIASTKTASKRTILLQQIHKACMDRAPRTADHRIKVCDCITRNYDKKLDDNDLIFLIGEFKRSDSKNTKEPPKNNPHQMTEMFSIDVSERCLEKPDWNIGDPE